MDCQSPPVTTPKPDNVRIASSEDEAEILRLMRMAHAEQPIASLSEDKLRTIIKIATDDDPKSRRGIVGVIDGPNGMEGYFCAVFSEWWFSTEWRIEELSTFVDPKYRDGKDFNSLIQFAKWAAESFGLILVLGITASERLLPKIRLYEKHINPFGALFFYNPRGGALAEISQC